MVKCVRDIILSNHLGDEVSEDDADNLTSPVTREEILVEQRYDDLRQRFMAKGTTGKGSVIFEYEDGIFFLQHPKDERLIEIVFPESLRSPLFRRAHSSPSSGHTGETSMH